jgi:hypothetical protein
MAEHTQSPEAALGAARAPRERLWGAVDALEAAIAAPAPGRIEAWRQLASTRLRDVSEAWAEHITTTEADDGLFAEIMGFAPRFAHAIERLRHEHETLRAAISASAVGLDAAVDESGVDASRADLLDLLALLARHRHRGIDLVYDAYNTDISAGD